MPQFLLTRDLTANAKLLYALLLARTQLSQRSGWVDETGSVYIIYTVRQMADALSCSVRSISSALCELEHDGLLRRVRRGWNRANRIYLLLPDDAQGTSDPCGRNCTVDAQLSSDHEWQNLPPIQKERDNRSIQKRGEIQARLSYGAHGNVFLTNDELALLRERYPGRYIAEIDDLSRRIAVEGEGPRDHCALLLRALEASQPRAPVRRSMPIV